MFIILENVVTGKVQRFNVYNIATYGESIREGKRVSFVEMSNNLERYDFPYYVKETPEEIDEMVDRFNV